ncbi:hypothetical protein RF55_19787, partial [Lasius niger]
RQTGLSGRLVHLELLLDVDATGSSVLPANWVSVTLASDSPVTPADLSSTGSGSAAFSTSGPLIVVTATGCVGGTSGFKDAIFPREDAPCLWISPYDTFYTFYHGISGIWLSCHRQIMTSGCFITHLTQIRINLTIFTRYRTVLGFKL